MQITIFGASGKVGELTVREAVRTGHSVVAFVHSRNPFEDLPEVTVIKGDVQDAFAVAKALEGSDAVVSALGSWGTTTKDTLSIAMEAIIPAMKQRGIKRIASVTGADARAPGDTLTLLHRMSHIIIGVIGKKVLSDSEKHIQLLAASQLEWTVVRSPIMNTGGDSQQYLWSAMRPYPWQTINRHSVVLALLQAATDPSAIPAHSPFIRRKAP